jgi:hypothetical protein
MGYTIADQLLMCGAPHLARPATRTAAGTARLTTTVRISAVRGEETTPAIGQAAQLGTGKRQQLRRIGLTGNPVDGGQLVQHRTAGVLHLGRHRLTPPDGLDSRRCGRRPGQVPDPTPGPAARTTPRRHPAGGRARLSRFRPAPSTPGPDRTDRCISLTNGVQSPIRHRPAKRSTEVVTTDFTPLPCFSLDRAFRSRDHRRMGSSSRAR